MSNQTVLHSLHDGSQLKVISAKELISIPIWQGNRTIDLSHVAKIKSTIGLAIHKLDYGYRIVRCDEQDAAGKPIEQRYVIDGQHRHRVIIDYFQTNLCENDFNVVVIETKVSSEAEIITHFKELNNQQPIQWKTDPNMLVNEYIKALEIEFNRKTKEVLIRPKATTRPYLSVEKLREELLMNHDRLKELPEQIKSFVTRVRHWNTAQVESAELVALHATKKGLAEIIEKAASHQFMLAVNPKLTWIRELI
jgi:hypothetical protein